MRATEIKVKRRLLTTTTFFCSLIIKLLTRLVFINKVSRAAVPLLTVLLAQAAFVICPLSIRAQNSSQAGSADNALRSNSRVNPSTRAMSIQIPLRVYAGRAGANLPITLNYSSKVWRMENAGVYWSACGGETGGGRWVTKREVKYGQYSASGWTTSLGIPRIEWPKDNDVYNWNGQSVCLECHSPQWNAENYWVIDRLYLYLPNGSTHEMRKGDTPHKWPVDRTGKYYAIDDSRLIYDADTNIIYMPDGSRYELSSSITKLIDRNGNTLVYDASAGQWTDTLGRTISLPTMGSSSTYSLKGSDGTPVNYIFHWTSLSSALTVSQDLKYNGEVIKDGTTGVCGDPPNVPYPGSLWGTSEDDSVIQTTNQPFNPVVLREIELPNGSKYRFSYNVYGEIDRIELPTGGTEEFTYKDVDAISGNTNQSTNRGVEEHKIRPVNGSSQGEQIWRYATSFVLSQDQTYAIYKMRETAPDYSYNDRYLFYGPPPPDRQTGTRIALFGFDDVRNGRPYDERVYSASGQMLSRKLTQWEMSSSQVTGPHSPHPSPTPVTVTATRSPKVKKEVMIISEPGANPVPTQALWTANVYKYEQAGQPLNVTATTQYGFSTVDLPTAQEGAIESFVPSAATALRTELVTYVQGTAYIDRNITGLPDTVTIKKGVGLQSDPIIGQTITKYDEANHLIQDYGPVANWSDPQNLVRGNITTIRKLVDVATNNFIETKTKYDQCGNVREGSDGNGNVSKIEYMDSFSDATPAVPTYAYPTKTTSPIPDLAGVKGSAVAFNSTVTYNYKTGLIVSTTDANQQTTTYEYDSLNRPTNQTRPAGGGWVSYEYGDNIGNIYIRTQSAQTTTQNLEAYKYFDGLGRPTKAFKKEGGTWIGIETVYDLMGRVEKSSNPYRTSTLGASSSGPWITNIYDDLGRKKIVITPDGGQFQTEYNLNTSDVLSVSVTLTDQSGRKQRSFTDAAGKLIRVIEPDANNSLDSAQSPATYYDYDLMGNLVKVTQRDEALQITQTRTFEYNALAQLKKTTGPEYGSIIYNYDNNGNLTSKLDARLITTTYTHDALNRVTGRSYSNASQPTPQVDYYYDGTGKPSEITGVIPNAKGNLTAVKSSVSESYYISYDALGRVKEHWQKTVGATQPYVMKYDYDLAGNMISQQYPSGRIIQTEYDQAGRLAGVKNSTGTYYAGAAPTDTTNRIQYTPHGAVSDVKLGNGLWEHVIYNSRLQIEEIGLGTTKGGIDRLKLSYSYDIMDSNGTPLKKNNGNILSQTIIVPTIGAATGFTATQTYAYDQVNRIKSISEAGGLSQTYEYDRWGNRAVISGYVATPSKIPTPTALGQFNRNNNRITTGDYDDAGNLVSVSGHSFKYDAENRMVSHDDEAIAGTTEDDTYSYDGNGKRVKKVFRSVTTIYVYNILGQLVAEYTDNSQQNGNGTSYFTADSLGSPRVTTNQQGNVLARHDYLPFGDEIKADESRRKAAQGYVAEGDGVRQKFTTYERDYETDLDFAQARYYASAQGRFTSPDPLLASGKPAMPQSWNRYTYCLNNPLVLVDPSGLEWGYADYEASGKKLRSYVWFKGKAGKYNGRQYKPVDFGNSISKDITLTNGSVVRMYTNGEATTLYTPPKLVERGAGFRNGAIGAMDKGPVPLFKPLRQLAGINADEDSAEYQAYGKLSLAINTALSALSLANAASLADDAAHLADDAAEQMRLGDLTADEVNQIQGVVDDAGRPLEVVGSAARGERGPASDIDYLVPNSSRGYFSGMEGRLPSVDPAHGLIPGVHNPNIGPAIRFEPGAAPIFVPKAPTP